MIERRTFLKFAGISSAGVSLPGFIAHAFGQDEEVPKDALQLAIERARGLGKPLLVFVIPEDTDTSAECYTRGEALGLVLEFGGDALYADLALCEVMCLPYALVKTHAPKQKDKPTALAVLFDSRPYPESPKRVPGEHEAMPTMGWEEAGKFEDPEKEVRKRYKAWALPIAKSLRDAIAPDEDALRAHARQANIAIGGKHSAVMQHHLEHAGEDPLKDVELEQIDAAAALVRFHTETSEAASKKWLPLLASAGRERLWKRPVPGARWATTDGCGVEFEDGNQDWAIDCGMGYVADTSRRFLWLYTEEETAK